MTAAAKAERALELRARGMPYRAIGAALGMSDVWAIRLCEREFANVGERVAGKAAAVLGEQLAIQEEVRAVAMAAALDPDTPVETRLRAIETVGRCQDRVIRWTGAAAPERVEVSGSIEGTSIRDEVQAMSDEEVAAELERIGWTRPPLAPPEPRG